MIDALFAGMWMFLCIMVGYITLYTLNSFWIGFIVSYVVIYRIIYKGEG